MRYPERYRELHTSAWDDAYPPPNFGTLNGGERHDLSVIPTHADGTLDILAPPLSIPTVAGSDNHDPASLSPASSHDISDFRYGQSDHTSDAPTHSSTFSPASTGTDATSALLMNAALGLLITTNPVLGTVLKAIVSSVPTESLSTQPSTSGSFALDSAAGDSESHVSGVTDGTRTEGSNLSSIAGFSGHR